MAPAQDPRLLALGMGGGTFLGGPKALPPWFSDPCVLFAKFEEWNGEGTKAPGPFSRLSSKV